MFWLEDPLLALTEVLKVCIFERACLHQIIYFRKICTQMLHINVQSWALQHCLSLKKKKNGSNLRTNFNIETKELINYDAFNL